MNDTHKLARHEYQCQTLFRATYLFERYNIHEGPNPFQDHGHKESRDLADESVRTYREIYAGKRFDP